MASKHIFTNLTCHDLQDAFSLIAYENPYESPFADLIHPRHRKILAKSINNAILGESDMLKSRIGG